VIRKLVSVCVALNGRRRGSHRQSALDDALAHTRDFDSSKVTAVAKQLSTYEATAANQDAFLKAARNVCDRAGKTVRALRELKPSAS
jgi:hypothetical protein